MDNFFWHHWLFLAISLKLWTDGWVVVARPAVLRSRSFDKWSQSFKCKIITYSIHNKCRYVVHFLDVACWLEIPLDMSRAGLIKRGRAFGLWYYESLKHSDENKMKNALQISPCSAGKMGTSTREINQNMKVQFFNYARNMHGKRLLKLFRQNRNRWLLDLQFFEGI